MIVGTRAKFTDSLAPGKGRHDGETAEIIRVGASSVTLRFDDGTERWAKKSEVEPTP